MFFSFRYIFTTLQNINIQQQLYDAFFVEAGSFPCRLEFFNEFADLGIRHNNKSAILYF
jgi:hypothetical protein